jgi:hypothetical protein
MKNTLVLLVLCLYDYHCLKHAYRQNTGLVLLCGYTSSFIAWFFFRKQIARTIVHMDGMEWQRVSGIL